MSLFSLADVITFQTWSGLMVRLWDLLGLGLGLDNFDLKVIKYISNGRVFGTDFEFFS